MVNLLATLGARIKAASTALAWPGGYPGPAGLPGQPYPNFVPADATGGLINLGLRDADGSIACPAWENSCVSIGLDWIARNFIQADLMVEQRDGDDWARMADHPLVALLDDPIPDHPTFDFHTLWAATALSCLAQGNGYWYKGRDGAGAVKELWPLNHEWVTPYRRSPSAPDFLYRYRVPIQGKADYIEDFDPADIVHFRWGQPDPRNDLLSVAPLVRCLLERMTDTEAARYRAAILANRGVPGLVVVYEDLAEAPANGREADEVKATLDHRFGGRRRGSTAILKGKVRLESHAFDPGKMDLGSLGHAAEARLAGALGVHPMVLGLSVGDAQRTYNNYKEADAQSWANGIRPLQGRMAEALYRQLLPDFAADRRDIRVAWDYSRVDSLQEDRDAISKRAIAEHLAGIRSRDESRAVLGLPPVDEGKPPVFWEANPHKTAVVSGDAGPSIATPAAKALEAKAARVLDRLEAELDDADRAGGRGGLAPIHDGPPVAGPAQILDARGRPVRAPGQSAWAPEWEADCQADAEDVRGDGDGGPGLAGATTPGPGPGQSPEPGPSRPAAGDGPGEADDDLPPRGGGADAHGPGAAGGDDLGAEHPGQ